MDATLDILPGEGDVVTTTKQRMRRECEECGEPAHYKQTFLMKGYRQNPASNAYRKDDCSWCSDYESFGCKEHIEQIRRNPPDGYVQGTTFPASERFAHMFLYWEEI